MTQYCYYFSQSLKSCQMAKVYVMTCFTFQQNDQQKLYSVCFHIKFYHYQSTVMIPSGPIEAQTDHLTPRTFTLRLF
jgi:hypothetical protein